MISVPEVVAPLDRCEVVTYTYEGDTFYALALEGDQAGPMPEHFQLQLTTGDVAALAQIHDELGRFLTDKEKPEEDEE